MEHYTIKDVRKIEKLLNCLINNKPINPKYLILFFKLLENGYITIGREWYPVPNDKECLIVEIQSMIKYLYLGIERKDTEIYEH